jgi:multidrug resistance efflux pump
LALATSELGRAQSLQRSSFATPETVDQRTAEQNSAQAAIDDAKAQIRDARILSIPALPRRSPAVSARVWSRSAVSLPAAVLAAARQPC